MENDIDDWLLLPSSDVSENEELEEEIEDELNFDRVFRQELEIQMSRDPDGIGDAGIGKNTFIYEVI